MPPGLERRAIVEVRSGPSAFRRALVAPGARLRVGRTSLADLVVPDDEALAQLHWELHWDGERAEVVDLGSGPGTMLGGKRVERAEARAGAWIRAGGTDFSIWLEDLSRAEARGPLHALTPMARKGRLYAVVDVARRDAILPMIKAAGDEVAPLYQGLQAEIEADGAPWLVRFEAASLLLPRLVARGHRDAWCIYLESRAPFGDVRAHLRRLLVVTRERDAEPMAFRFFDPRVLRAFLPIATRRQVEQLLGPVERFFAEAFADDRLIAFARGEDGFFTQTPLEVPRAEGQ